MSVDDGDWVCLHRKIWDSQIGDDLWLVGFWVYLFSNANWKDGWFKGIRIKRGQFATSQLSLAKRLKCHRSKIQRSLSKLREIGQISISKPSNQFTVITICNYSLYQNQKSETDQRFDQRPINERSTPDQRVRTIEQEEQRNKETREQRTPPTPPDASGGSTEFPSSLRTTAFAASWSRWRRHLIAKKSHPTSEMVAEWLTRCANWGEPKAIVAIEHSISRGWAFIDYPPEWDQVAKKAQMDRDKSARVERQESLQSRLESELHQHLRDRPAILDDIRREAAEKANRKAAVKTASEDQEAVQEANRAKLAELAKDHPNGEAKKELF